VLCVPGLGLDAAAWEPTLRAWEGPGAASPRLVATLPGFGERPPRGADLRPAVLGARLAEQQLARETPTVLLGHSASCQVVAHAARLAPGGVSLLVLVGPTTDPRAATWPRIAARWLATALHERPGQVPLLARSYTRTGLGWAARAMDAARRDDVRVTLRDTRCPVLVVRGRHDRICPADWAEAVATCGAEGSRAVTLAAGAHMVPLTHGDRVAAAVRTASY